MKNIFAKLLVGVLFVLGTVGANAQTTLISSTGAGGFELAVPTGTPGTDYTANGWTVVNGANNRLWIGTTAVPSAGTYSSFSGISAASFTGEANANVNHFYRDITFPAGETNITLTFKYKIPTVDGTFDYLKLWLVPTSTTPVAGTQLSSGQIGNAAGYDGVVPNAATSYAIQTVTIPASAAGTTQRLVFSWRTDGASPNAAIAIDEISLTSATPVTYTWNQTGTAAYGTAANWTPTRTTPATSDKLVFDGAVTGGTLAITSVPTETIDKFYLTNSAVVTLATVTSTKTLTLNTELNIGSGSSLTFTGTGSVGLTMAMGSGSTATIAGTMTMNTTASATWTVTSLTSSTISGTVNNGGTITGGTTTNLSFTSTGIYNHTQNGGTIPTATYAAGSNVNVTGITTTVVTPPSTIGGNFTWNSTGQTGLLLTMGSGLTSIGGTCNILSTGTGSFLFGTTTPPTVTGLFTISGGTLSASGGTFTLNGGMTVSGGTISGASATNTTFTVNGNFSQSGSGTITSAATTASVITLSVTGTFNQSAGTISETSTGSIAINFTGSTNKAVTLSGTNTTGIINYRINNGNNNGITLTGTLSINAGATLTVSIGGTSVTGGTVSYTGSTSGLVYNATTANQTINDAEFPVSSGPGSLTINNTNTAPNNRVTFGVSASRTLSGTFTQTAGVLLLGGNDLTVTGAISGTASNTNFVATNGAGQLKKIYTGTGTTTFPLGDITGTDEASAATVNYTTLVGASSTVGAKVTDAQHPNDASVSEYLTRYFTFTETGATSYTYSLTLNYQSGDVVGTAAQSRLNRWNGSAWNQVSSAVPTSTNVAATGILSSASPLNSSDFTLRPVVATTYTWKGGASAAYNVTTNWNPTRTTPDASDILQFNGSNIDGVGGTGSITATAVPTETIGQLILLNNANVTLQPGASGNILTIGGASGTDLDVPSGSTLTIGNTNATKFTVAFSGTTTSTIAGTVNVALNTNVPPDNTLNTTNCTMSITGANATIGNAGVITSTISTLTFATTTFYNHNWVGSTTNLGTIPTATWSSGSTVQILAIVSPTAGNFPSGATSQTFSNFVWNTPSMTTAPNLSGLTLTINNTFTMTSTGSSTLKLGTNSSGTINCANYSQTGGTLEMSAGTGIGTLKVSSTFNQSAGIITETSTGSGTIEFNGSSSQSVTPGGTISQTISYKVSNPAGIAVTGTLALNAGTTFTAAADGTAVTTGTVTYSTTTTLAYVTSLGTQTTGNEFPSTSGPVNVTFNNTNSSRTITLSGSRTVTGTLTLTGGRVTLGANDLTLANGGTLTATSPGATNMIVTDGAGFFKRGIPATTGTYLFPIGEVTGTTQYTPVSLQFLGNSAIRIIGARTIDAIHPSINTGGTPVNYLSRYWNFFENSAGGTYNYYINPAVAITGAEDEVGTAASIKAAYWNGSAWALSTNTYSSGSLVSNIAGVSEAVGNLNTTEWTGRDAPPVSYTWVGFTDGVWGTAANWSPSGVPISSDAITLTNGSTGAAANLNLTSAVSVNDITFNGTGNFFTVAAAGSITAGGNVTYTAGTGTWNSASTFSISSASSQTIPPFAYGNLTGTGGNRVWSTGTTGIAGTFTPGGTYTATSGSTVDYNGAAGQNIQSVNYFNLTNSSNTTRTTLSGTIDIAGAYTPTTAVITNNSSNTVNFSSASAQTIPTAAYTNIANTGNGDRTLATTGANSNVITISNGFTPGSGTYTTTGSTVEFTGTTTYSLSAFPYYNLKLNSSGAGVWSLASGITLAIANDLTLAGTSTTSTLNVSNTASTNVLNVSGNLIIQDRGRFNLAGATSTGATANITGNLTISGTGRISLESVSSSTGVGIINVTGNFISTATSVASSGANGIVDFGITGATVTGNAINIAGNFDKSGAGTFGTNATGAATGFVFNKTGTQTFSYSGAASDYTSYTVASTSTLQLLTGLSLSAAASPSSSFTVNGTLDVSTFTIGGGATNGSFILASGATLKTSNTNGVVSTTVGSVSTSIATRTFNAAANYEFYGSSAIPNTNFPNSTLNNLTISNTAGVTMGAAVTVNGNWTVGSGGILNASTFAHNLKGNWSNTGTLNASTGKFIFSGAGGQTMSGSTFYDLEINDAGGVTMLTDETVSNTLTLTNGAFTVGANTLTLNGTAIAGTPNNLTTTSASSLTFGGSLSGVFVPSGVTNLSTLTINNTNAAGVTLNGNITLATGLVVNTGGVLDAGTNQLLGSGTATINGTLKTSNTNGFAGSGKTIDAATVTLGSASTIEYNAGGAQTVDARSDYANLTLSAAGAKTFGGNSSVSGNFTVGGGSVTVPTLLTFNGSAAQNIAGLTYTDIAMSGAGNKTFTSDGSLSGTMTFSGGPATVDFDGSGNNKIFTIKSNATNTARIANVNGFTLSGNVTMERWIPQRGGSPTGGRAYRLLAPTVNTTSTIRANWMEGGLVTTIGVASNPVPTYGTHITGVDGNTNDFDVTQSNASSLYATTNAVTPTYTAMGSTTSGIGIATMNALTGYFLYIRGDRSVSLQVPLGTNMPTTSTTLRTTGTLVTGTQSTFTNAYTGGGALNLVTNPYPSPIDWALVKAASSNITNFYTLWDPNVGTRGGFVTVSTGGSVSGGGTATINIQSGQAFFVESDGVGTPAVSIQEGHKVAGNNNTVFLVPPESFRTALYFIEDSGYRRMADGVNVLYDNVYSPSIDANDAKEIGNWDENIAIDRETKHLAIEGRPVILVRDTIPLFMNNMKERAYSFDFIPASFTNIGIQAELIDNFLNTRTLLSVLNTITVNFTVTADPASKATNRFMVVFGPQAPLAIDVITIRAQAKYQPAAQGGNGVQVDWTAKTEKDMDRYELERSFNGTDFTKINTVMAVGNSNVPVNYSWLDVNPQTGNNFYRIKAIDKAGLIKYTTVVKVNFGKAVPAITVYPNPVKDNTINLQLNDIQKGAYSLSIINNLGQIIYRTQVQHAGGSATIPVTPVNDLAKGVYELVLSGENIVITNRIIKN